MDFDIRSLEFVGFYETNLGFNIFIMDLIIDYLFCYLFYGMVKRCMLEGRILYKYVVVTTTFGLLSQVRGVTGYVQCRLRDVLIWSSDLIHVEGKIWG